MNKLTLVLDTFCYDIGEMKDYLLALAGIYEVVIDKNGKLKIDLKYDSNLISIEKN